MKTALTLLLVHWNSCSLPLSHRNSLINFLSFFVPVSTLGVNCRTTFDGYTYTGNLNVTTSGFPCQRWDSHWPYEHNHNDISEFPDANLDEASNYCRNPIREEPTLWCYTTASLRWDFCAVPMCNGKRKHMMIIADCFEAPYAPYTWLNANETDSGFGTSQRETPLLCNDVSHWLGARRF